MAAALVAWLLVMGDVLGFVHQAAEAHAVCAEHGELVHTGDAHAGALAEPRDPGVGAEASAAPGTPHGGEHEAADHCRACASAHDPVALAVADRVPDGVIEESFASLASPVEIEVSGRAVHRVAPKTSPPVA